MFHSRRSSFAMLFCSLMGQSWGQSPIRCVTSISADDSAQFGTYFPMSGSASDDFNGLFRGKNCWTNVRQRALMEESFLHELVIDKLLDSLELELKSNTSQPRAAIQASLLEGDILFASDKERLLVRLVRREITSEPIRIDFEYRLGSNPPYQAQFYFPEGYRRPVLGQPEGGRALRRRRLIWGLNNRFKGSWSPELYEFFMNGILSTRVLKRETRQLVSRIRYYPRQSLEAARVYYRNYYPNAEKP